MSDKPLEGEILPPATDLNPDAIERLAAEFFQSINHHYLRSPVCMETVCEVLNALAVVAGSIIRGTKEEGGPGAEPFFREALDLNLKIKD